MDKAYGRNEQEDILSLLFRWSLCQYVVRSLRHYAVMSLFRQTSLAEFSANQALGTETLSRHKKGINF